MTNQPAAGRANLVDQLERLRGYLKSIAVVKLGSRLQAKLDPADVVQQTMLDAHRDLHQFRGDDEAQLKAWLRKILANNLNGIFRDYQAQRRDARREVPMTIQVERSSQGLERVLAADQTSPSQLAQRNERYEQLAAALSRLPEEQRMAVILKHIEGWPLADIAQEMGNSDAAIGGLLKRGLKKLNGLLSE